jgi:hypothetical protein
MTKDHRRAKISETELREAFGWYIDPDNTKFNPEFAKAMMDARPDLYTEEEQTKVTKQFNDRQLAEVEHYCRLRVYQMSVVREKILVDRLITEADPYWSKDEYYYVDGKIVPEEVLRSHQKELARQIAALE